MPNVRHIAKQAGVSITTVSRVLNNHPGVSDAARQAVLAAVNQAGYVPEVGRRSTSNIALLYTDSPTLDSPFDTALLVGMYEGLQKLGCDLMILDAHRSRREGEAFSHMFLRKGVQGALLRTTTSSRAICQEIAKEGFPAVAMGYRLDEAEGNCIYSDSREASHKAIEHLVQLGHRRIAVCIHVVEDSDHADRVAAYRQTLEAHGLAFDERLVLRLPASREGGMQAVRHLMAMPDRPTALFLTDPLTSIGALTEARRLGLRVPADLSLVTFDDTELRLDLVPQLTAVCQDTKALGREAVALLGQLIADRRDSRPRAVALDCWLELHESTAPPLALAAGGPASGTGHTAIPFSPTRNRAAASGQRRSRTRTTATPHQPNKTL